MHLVLLALGVLLVVLGVGAVLYGIPINEFRFGDTLIISGTVSFTGGLLLIGLALAVRQLRRIAETLDLQPMAWMAAPDAVVQRSASPVSVKPPVPAEEPVAGPSEPAAPVVSVAPPVPSAEPVAMPPPRRSLREWLGRPTPVPPEVLPAPAPVKPPPLRPAEPTRSPRADLAALARAPQGPIEAAKQDGAAEGSAAPQHSSLSRVRPSRENSAAKARDDGVQVYKSGVVEGMAYTLYTDGAIDAELPEGTRRFNSLAELRAHLAGRG